jgi:sulfur transfer complex TusBCD TusB component (DsrH family)
MIQYYTQIVNKKVFNLYDFRTNQIARIPIPKLLNQENFQKIVKTVINLRLIQNRDLSRDIQNLQKSLVVMLNNLVFEVYFRDKISSSLNEVIEEENLFLLEKDVTDRNIERSYKKYLDLVNNKPVSTQIHKILSFPEVVEVKKSLDHC